MSEDRKPDWPLVDRRAADPNIRDLQEKMGKILDRLTKIETVLELRADYERRIRDLEQKLAKMEGRASVMAAIVGAAASVVVSVVSALIIWVAKG